MLRTADIIMALVMTAAAAATYSIKHRAEVKLDEVRRLEAEIKLENDTIDLLKADWALLTQPNRLEKLIEVYKGELPLVPTESTSLAQPSELPMLKADLPPPPPPEPGKDPVADKIAAIAKEPLPDVAVAAPAPVAAAAEDVQDDYETGGAAMNGADAVADVITTGAVE